MSFFYVYLLTDRTGNHHYVGVTNDLKDRLGRHNRGEMTHTTKHRPWQIQSAVAFDSEQRAVRFERYLKSYAGREWAKRHL